MLAVGMSQRAVMAVLLPLAQEGSRSGSRSGSNPVLPPLAQPQITGGGGACVVEDEDLRPACGAGSRSGSGSDQEDMLPACGDISATLDMSDDDEDEGKVAMSSLQSGSTMQPGGTLQPAASTVSRPVPIPAAVVSAGAPTSRPGSLGIGCGANAADPGGSGSGSFVGGHLRDIWPVCARDSGSNSPAGGSFSSAAAPDQFAAWNGGVSGTHACGSLGGSSYSAAVCYSGSTLPWQCTAGVSPSGSSCDAGFGSHLLALGGLRSVAAAAAADHGSGSRSMMGSSPDPLFSLGSLGAGPAAISAFCSVRGPTPEGTTGDADDQKHPTAASLRHSDISQPSLGSAASLKPVGILLSQPGGTAPSGSTIALGSSRDKHPLLKRRLLVSPAAAAMAAVGAADVAGGARKQYGSWEQYIAQQPYGHDHAGGVLHPSPRIHASESSENFMLLLECEDPALSHASAGSRSFGSGIPASCSSSNLLDLLPDFL